MNDEHITTLQKYDATYDGSGMNQISFGHIHH
jgi:hypothetical protein